MEKFKATWRFYGRNTYLKDLKAIFDRQRWFFLKISGRRRIGKTSLIQEALASVSGQRSIFYVQLPDSEPAGVLSVVADALHTFSISNAQFPKPQNLGQLAKLIGIMAESGYIVVLDDFQYLHRKGYEEFCSQLQSVVDSLSAKAETITGGLIVLGSIHTEMAALLEDRGAPLYGRVTDAFDLPHLDISSVIEILRDHAEAEPNRLLFLWNLFEGVPKFYRDCYERGVLAAPRHELLRKIFFESSSPLRSEANSWFLRELRGRYDHILKYLAKNPGSMHSDLVQAIRDLDGDKRVQISGYLHALVHRYQLIDKKQPIFSKSEARKNRYYLADNFLQAWLAALAPSVAALAFRPLDHLIAEADQKLAEVEGRALEKLVRQIYEERSRLGKGDFPLTHAVQGYWDRNDTEIDLVACNDIAKTIRFVSCKRSPSKAVADALNLQEHAARFITAKKEYRNWKKEYAAVSLILNQQQRKTLAANGVIGQDLNDLLADLG